MHRSNPTRREVLGVAAGLTALPLLPAVARADQPGQPATAPAAPESAGAVLTINGRQMNFSIEPRTTLLDLLREQTDMTGTKKGCDQGSCGACTVHIDGHRVLACLTLAVRCEDKAVTTIEGLASGDELHPMQAAFLEHDAFQCGYCTPGQIMSAVALVQEGHAGSDDEIREWMSGNICRCGAYPNIVDAVRDAASASRKG
jgi:xanthine dehydrogenase YagT iron-sulfur-binding subunit